MRAWMANVAAVAGAGGVLALGLTVGAPEVEANAPANRATLAAPAPLPTDSSMEVSLGDGLTLWGQPSRLSLFWTGDASIDVVRLYSDAWEAAGLEPMVRRLDRVSSVSAVEPATGLMRSVTVLDAGDERLVLPSLTDVRHLPDLSARNAPVPIPENARAYSAQFSDDVNAAGYHATYLVPLTPSRAVEFYRVNMEERGYRQIQSTMKGTPGGAQTAEFERGSEWINVVATPTDPKKGAKSDDETAFVAVTHVRALDAPQGLR